MLLSLIAAIVSSALVSGKPAGASPDNFVVHEWGTFTTFSGSDGTPRRFSTEAGAGLPEFVYSRGRQAGDEESHELERIKAVRVALVRMETPVTYFYTDRPRRVDVDVSMPQGALTEFYPPVTRMEPAFAGLGSERNAEGRLVWNGVDLIPPSAEGVPLPPVGSGDHYSAAREVDAAFVRFTGPGGTHFERFLFYRGVADFQPPLTVGAMGEGRFEVRGSDGAPAAWSMIMEVSAGKVRFAGIPGGQTRTNITLPGVTSSVDAAAKATEQALVDAGLFKREAAAMVKTWRSSWFGEEGTRALYILPASEVDRLLPLKVTPTPDRTERVYVGRVEILTPEAQAGVESVLAWTAGPEAWNDPALKQLGRFAYPAVQHVAEFAKSVPAGSAARRLLGR